MNRKMFLTAGILAALSAGFCQTGQAEDLEDLEARKAELETQIRALKAGNTPEKAEEKRRSEEAASQEFFRRIGAEYAVAVQKSAAQPRCCLINLDVSRDGKPFGTVSVKIGSSEETEKDFRAKIAGLLKDTGHDRAGIGIANPERVGELMAQCRMRLDKERGILWWADTEHPITFFNGRTKQVSIAVREPNILIINGLNHDGSSEGAAIEDCWKATAFSKPAPAR